MFQTVKRIVDWCGEFKGKLYAGFVMTFFSHIFTAMPLALAAYTIGLLIESVQNGTSFDTSWIWKSILIQVGLVFFRFLFDYFRARLQEPIGYQLTARDRLAVGDALKRVSLGYFQQVSTGNILNSITTGLSTLEGMGIRMIDNFVGGYLNFLVIFLALLICSPLTSLIALAAAALSFAFLMVISHYSHKNAPVEAQANQDMTGAIIEYARGLAVVKSFGKTGAAMDSVKQAIHDSKKIHLKIEWGYLPGNALHLMALKCGSVGLAMASALMCLSGQMDFSMALLFLFFSFSIFASLEPISDSAHTLGVIEDAMNQLDALKGEHFIDADGADIPLQHYDIQFEQVQFGYEAKRPILKDVSFRIPEKTSTAIVGPSGSGKTTLATALQQYFLNDGTGCYLLSGDDYPHRIPKRNDEERLRVYKEAGEDGLRGYLGTKKEIDFDRINEVLAAFHEGKDTITLRHLGREDGEISSEETDFSGISVLLLEWTHGGSDDLHGVDLSVFLESSPEETKERRIRRNRDENAASPFICRVVGLEQEKLEVQRKNAGLIVGKDGSVYEQ